MNIYSIEASPQGTLITIQSRYREKVFLRKKVWVDEAFSTLKWKYHNLLDEIELYAYRHGNRITLRGMSRGASVERTYKIDDNPWKQQFPLDLEKFALSEFFSRAAGRPVTPRRSWKCSDNLDEIVSGVRVTSIHVLYTTAKYFVYRSRVTSRV